MTPRLPVANYTITHHDETCWDYQKLNHWTVFAFVFKVKVIVAYKFYNFFKHFQPLNRFLQLYPSSWFQPISKIGSSLWIIFPKKSGWKKWPRWPTWFHGFIRHLRRETSLDPIGTWNFVEENQPTPQRIHRCRGHSLPQGVEWTRGVSRFKPLRPKAKDGCGVFWKIAGFFLILEKKLPLV